MPRQAGKKSSSEIYHITVIRYIHQNPFKVGICKKVESYKFSSYREYMETTASAIDRKFVFGIIIKEDFAKYNQEICFDECFDVDEKKNKPGNR